jgi:hypothetical protein
MPGPAAPAALTEIAATAHDGAVWIAGGLDGSGAASDRVYVFDPGLARWDEGPRLQVPIHHSALVSDGSALYLLGGYTGNSFNSPTDQVWVLRARDASWEDGGGLPEARAAGGATWDGERIIYAGGVGPDGVVATTFAQAQGDWVLVGRLSEGREHLAATADGGGTAFALGGRRGGLEGNLATVDLITSAGMQRLAEIPTPRGGVAAFWWPRLGACLIGGESAHGTNGEAECIDDAGRTTPLPPLATPRHGLGAAVLDGIAYALLGGPEPGLFVSDTVETLTLPR